MKKYALMRKDRKGVWMQCGLWTKNLESIPGNMSEDLALVKSNRDDMRKNFPEEKYSIFETLG